MQRIVRRMALLALLAALVGLPAVSAAQAQGSAVRRVILIEVQPGQLGAYLQRLSQVMAIQKRLDLPASRIFQATLAGPNTNTISYVTDHPSLAAFAANNTKLQADAEWQGWIEELNKAGIRRVVSNSLLGEVTPWDLQGAGQSAISAGSALRSRLLRSRSNRLWAFPPCSRTRRRCPLQASSLLSELRWLGQGRRRGFDSQPAACAGSSPCP